MAERCRICEAVIVCVACATSRITFTPVSVSLIPNTRTFKTILEDSARNYAVLTLFIAAKYVMGAMCAREERRSWSPSSKTPGHPLV